MSNKTIGIIGAMECEVESIKARLNNVEIIKQGVLNFYKGEFHGKTVIAVQSGVGKTCGAVCVQLLVDKFNPDCIINTGVAGGLGEGMQVADIVIAKKLVYHDFDATAIGYAKGYICNNTNSKEPTYFYADEKLVDTFKKVIPAAIPELRFHEGVIASGDMFVGSSEKKKEIKDLFNAVAVEMEGAAIAHAATLNEVPFMVIRALSDLADEQAHSSCAFNEKDSAEISAKTIIALVENL